MDFVLQLGKLTIFYWLIVLRQILFWKLNWLSQATHTAMGHAVQCPSKIRTVFDIWTRLHTWRGCHFLVSIRNATKRNFCFRDFEAYWSEAKDIWGQCEVKFALCEICTYIYVCSSSERAQTIKDLTRSHFA